MTSIAWNFDLREKIRLVKDCILLVNLHSNRMETWTVLLIWWNRSVEMDSVDLSGTSFSLGSSKDTSEASDMKLVPVNNLRRAFCERGARGAGRGARVAGPQTEFISQYDNLWCNNPFVPTAAIFVWGVLSACATWSYLPTDKVREHPLYHQYLELWPQNQRHCYNVDSPTYSLKRPRTNFKAENFLFVSSKLIKYNLLNVPTVYWEL